MPLSSINTPPGMTSYDAYDAGIVKTNGDASIPPLNRADEVEDVGIHRVILKWTLTYLTALECSPAINHSIHSLSRCRCGEEIYGQRPGSIRGSAENDIGRAS